MLTSIICAAAGHLGARNIERAVVVVGLDQAAELGPNR